MTNMPIATSKILSLILLVLGVCLVDSVLTALFAYQVWWSFLSLQYGDGPTVGAWFGISLIVGAIMTSVTTVSDGGNPPTASSIITRSLSRWVFLACALLMAMFAGALAGWAR